MEFPCNTEIPPAIPDGAYEMQFVRAEESHQWNCDKVFLWFAMLTPGPWEGKEFFMACNARKDGQWGPSHKYMQAWILANGSRPVRRDRISTKVFRGKVFRAQLRTVSKNANQTARTPAQQYSVIGELLERVRGVTDVPHKPLIGLEDVQPQVGMSMGAGEGAREGTSPAISYGNGMEEGEYERELWNEYEEEYEEECGEECEDEDE